MKYLILFALLGLARGDCGGTTWGTCIGECFWDNGGCYAITENSGFSSYEGYTVSDEDLDNFDIQTIGIKLSNNEGITQARYYNITDVDGDTATISYCEEDGGWFNFTAVDTCTPSSASHTENKYLLVKQHDMIDDAYTYTYYCSNDGEEYAKSMGGELCTTGNPSTEVPPTCPDGNTCTCIDEDGNCYDEDDDWGYITFAHPTGDANPCDVNSYDKTACCLTKTVAAEYINAQCCDCS